MKPSSMQLESVRTDLAAALEGEKRSLAEIGRLAEVHSSQVSRICGGEFHTFSSSVVQICKVLGVKVPTPEAEPAGTSPEWAAVQSSMRRIWDETPEGARTIAKLLGAVADLQGRSGSPGEG